jgi:HAD superfamily hydrolase (TIGR01509 family)
MIHPHPRGIIFDMDGTLTVPVISFVDMRSDIGIPPTGDIIGHIQDMGKPEQDRAWSIIARHEQRASDRATLQPDTHELLTACRQAGLRMGLLTRNTRASALDLCRRYHLDFDPICSREFPFTKPRPEPIYHICACWDLPPAQTLMVGDYLHDVEAGNAAGARSCFLRNRGKPDFSHHAHYSVSSLFELKRLLGV